MTWKSSIASIAALARRALSCTGATQPSADRIELHRCNSSGRDVQGERAQAPRAQESGRPLVVLCRLWGWAGLRCKFFEI
jgi:hypothetical protein